MKKTYKVERGGENKPIEQTYWRGQSKYAQKKSKAEGKNGKKKSTAIGRIGRGGRAKSTGGAGAEEGETGGGERGR